MEIEDILEEYARVNGEQVASEYSKLLVGRKVEEFLGTTVGYIIEGSVKLDDGHTYDSHFRFGVEQEEDTGKEIGFVTMEEHYKKCILGKTITSIEVGVNRENCYVYAYGDNTEYCLEIPMQVEIEIYRNELLAKHDETEKTWCVLCPICNDSWVTNKKYTKNYLISLELQAENGQVKVLCETCSEIYCRPDGINQLIYNDFEK
jgi:hypothetical protein